jgi:hypothetical protein
VDIPKSESAEYRTPMSDGFTKTSRNPSDTARTVKRGVLIGNGDEALGPIAVSFCDHTPLRFLSHDVRLDRRARFAGENEQRILRASHRRADGIGIDRIKHAEPRIASGRAKHLPQDLGCQARAAHAEQDDVSESALSDGVRERTHARHERCDEVERGEPAEPVGDDLSNCGV